MQIVIEHRGEQHEVDLLIEGPDACVADLVDAVEAVDGGITGAGVVIEGRFFGPDACIDEIGLHEGALVRITSVRTTSTAPERAPAGLGPVLAVIDGPDAGLMHPLGTDEVLIGHGEDCDLRLDDPTLSRRHARLCRQGDGAFVVTDLQTLNGTWIDGVAVSGPVVVRPGALLRMGATHARVLADVPDDRPVGADPLLRATGGLVLFNRPPRPALPEELRPLEAPQPPVQPGRGRTLSVISIVAPLVMGLVLFAIMKDWRFALFLLLSPVMALGNWLAARRSTRKEAGMANRAFRRALEDFDRDLARRAAQETARREQLLPDAAETLRRARTPSTRLWERRCEHPDFLHLRAGIGSTPWSPPVSAGRDGLPEAVETAVAPHRTLRDAPVEVDLSSGGVVGLGGDRAAALALARSLVCQAAVHHGPADLGIAIMAAQAHAPDWDWAKWLPHVRDEAGASRMLSGDWATSDTLLGDLMAGSRQDQGPKPRALRDDSAATARTRLLVLDDISLTEGRRAPARLLLRGAAGPSAGIVVAASADQLPAVTTTVIELRSPLGDADLQRPQERVRIDGFVISGLSQDAARQAARALARYEDPELALAGAGLPQLVRLLPLLGMDETDAGTVRTAWKEGLPDPTPNGPIGIGEDGVVQLDLVKDGPHGLIGGTTGSGKSELLRSMVAGMAARVDPDHLVFVLVDYKGGSAFDQCARLPHTVGMVTDLDEHLGERALKSLEAELAHRERLLRSARAPDLTEYLRIGAPLGPVPRLVVVIDEFATLAAELPDFISALVGVAQRGRSLGVHLILATQRPSGAVSANIKANTNLRIALRVQDASDSTDIIDAKDAAAISRANPGRAYIRRGAGDVVLAQTALSTAAASGRPASGVRLEPFRFGPAPSALGTDGGGNPERPTDLARLVDAVQAAFDRSGMAPPRRPWLEMLPERLELETVLAACDGACDRDVIAFALADDPEQQRQAPIGWDPRDGHLALFGMLGSGTTTAMLAVARTLVQRESPDRCRLYAIDFGAGGLAPLGALPHVGAVVAANDHEAQFRLLRRLRHEVDRRRALPPDVRRGQPRTVVLIDGISSFLAEHDDIEAAETAEAFRRVFCDGPAVDVLFVLAGDRPGSLPVRLSSLVSQKVLFRLADPSDFSCVGLRAAQLPSFVPGRAVHGQSKLVIQVGHPGDDLPTLGDTLRARWPDSCPPPGIASLPAQLQFEHLPGGALLTSSGTQLTLGVADEDLGPAVLAMRPNDHALVAGPPQCGKTSTLMLIASLVRVADPRTVLVGICDERSPLSKLEALDAAGTLAHLAHIVQAAPGDERRWLILVDDACRTDDVNGVLMAAVRCGRPGLHVIAADRADDLHGGWGNWARAVRQSRTGVLLQPSLTQDGALLSARLPRRLPIPLVPGRGFVVSAGQPALAQIALPPKDGYFAA